MTAVCEQHTQNKSFLFVVGIIGLIRICFTVVRLWSGDHVDTAPLGNLPSEPGRCRALERTFYSEPVPAQTRCGRQDGRCIRCLLDTETNSCSKRKRSCLKMILVWKMIRMRMSLWIFVTSSSTVGSFNPQTDSHGSWIRAFLCVFVQIKLCAYGNNHHIYGMKKYGLRVLFFFIHSKSSVNVGKP